MELSKRWLIGLLAGSSAFTLARSAAGQEMYVEETDPLVIRKLEEWQDLKLGLLMHWGPYSQ